MTDYVHLLVSIIHPAYETTINCYAISVSLSDSRMRTFTLDHWAKPENRKTLLSLLCEDWLTDGCDVVGCEQIAGAVQWRQARGPRQ